METKNSSVLFPVLNIWKALCFCLTILDTNTFIVRKTVTICRRHSRCCAALEETLPSHQQPGSCSPFLGFLALSIASYIPYHWYIVINMYFLFVPREKCYKMQSEFEIDSDIWTSIHICKTM